MDIQLDNIGFAIKGKPLVSDVSFDIPQGGFVSLLGASGAGKSTLLKIIAGILPQTKGSVLFNGRSIDNIPAHKRHCAMVFQDIRLFPHMSVLENVAFPLNVAHVPRHERIDRAQELLRQVGLAGFGQRPPSELSGGQAQRVALARAFASSPAALLLDEPFAGLDEQLRDDMRSLVLRLHRTYGITTLMVTHDAHEALMMSDSVSYLASGRLIQNASPHELYAHPASREIARCFGKCSEIEGSVENGIFQAGGLRIAASHTPNGKACAIVRNSGVRLEPSAAGSLTVRCGVFCGEHFLTRVDVAGQTLSVPTATLPEAQTRVNVRIDPQHCFIFPHET